jgi:hypothetical protein
MDDLDISNDDLDDLIDEGTEPEIVEEPSEDIEGGEIEDNLEGNEPIPEPTKSRAQARIEKQQRELNEWREKAIRAETLAAERGRAPSQDTNSDAARAREERLALMDPVERQQIITQEKIDAMQQSILLTQLQTQDNMDKQEYAFKVSGNDRAAKLYSKYSSQVEERLAQERREGRNWPRDVILRQIVGEALLSAKPKANPAARAASDRVSSVQARSVSGRSNVASSGGRGNSMSDLERRLENIEI